MVDTVDKQKNSFGSLLVGIAGGVALGTAATMYLSDEKRRKLMRKKFQQLSDSVKGNFSRNTLQLEKNVSKKAGDTISTMQKKSNDVMNKEREVLDKTDDATKKLTDRRVVH